METKKIFLYNNKEAKEEANEESKEKAKKAIDVIDIFFVPLPTYDENYWFITKQVKTSFLP